MTRKTLQPGSPVSRHNAGGGVARKQNPRSREMRALTRDPDMLEKKRQNASVTTEPLPSMESVATDRGADDEPAAQIEFATETTGGLINGRFDVELRGRVTASMPIEAVELLAGTGPVGRIEYGEPLAAPATLMPDGTPGRQRAFQFVLPCDPKAAGICHLQLRVIGSERMLARQELTLAIDPAGRQPVQITSGPARPLADLPALLPPIVLYVERAAVDDRGEILLHGWSVAMRPLVTVQAYLGEHRLPAAQLRLPRDDVALHYPAYPNARASGFMLTAKAIPEHALAAEAIRVQAISRNGFSHEVLIPLERLPTRPHSQASAAGRPPRTANTRTSSEKAPSGVPEATEAQTIDDAQSAKAAMAAMTAMAAKPAAPSEAGAPDREIRYFCDEASFQADGTLRVVGWAICAAGLREIAVELDGTPIGVAEFGLPRPDVGAEFADIPTAQSAGFRFEQIFPDIAGGSHDLRIILRNHLGDQRDETRALQVSQPVVAKWAPVRQKASEQAEFRFELDSPQVLSGSVVEPVSGRLTIEGWVLARSGVERVDIYLDDQRLGEAHYGLARQDVGAAFPDWGDALRSGYAFHCPPRALHDGEHVVRLQVWARNGQTLERSFRIDVKKSDENDHLANIRRRIGHVEATVQADLLDSIGYRPRFCLLVRQAGVVSLNGLQATLESLQTQAYKAWRAILLVEAAEAACDVRAWLGEQRRELAARVTVLDGTQPEFDSPLVSAGESESLFGLLCPADLLACDALTEIALSAGLHRQPDFLYADESRAPQAGENNEPFFKPDFSPDLLLSTNYIGRPWFARGSLLLSCEATARTLSANGEYDLVLRCTELAQSIHHVPKLLAERGTQPLEDDESSRTALARAAERRGFAAAVQPGCLPGIYRLRRTQSIDGKVSIIIPTCAAHGHIETCIRTLREKTAYKNFEIVCIDNIPSAEPRWKAWIRQNADQVVEIPDAFNWSRFNNIAAAATNGEYLLFLNDDIEITQQDWLDALLEHAQRPEVGIVGPQLLYPDGKVQHAGMFLGSGVGRHAFRFAPHDEPGYFGLALTQRNVIAVTGACMLMRRGFFEAMRGFEEAHSVINNDLDFCLRAHQAGKLIVYTPYASLLHHELASRGRMGDTFDTAHFDTNWRTTFAAGDPFFSPRLSRQSDDYRPDDEAVQTVFPLHPLFAREEIHRILVVKLDHIGDFVTALPAMRRLKGIFPHATLSVLAGSAARAVTKLEPSIDEFIEFEFFHSRSQLGEKRLTSNDFDALREKLAPYRFDLAIDLRKHPSTRDVLRHTGARFLAGYDYAGQFPFLDIALEWDGDKMLQRKRNHVVNDLLALVEAVNAAGLDRRELLRAGPEPIALHALPESVQALFERPVVALHAGAGNVSKQWPQEYFAALVELLLQRDRVNVLLVGGPDEREVSEDIVQGASLRHRVASVAGDLPLADLPSLLVRCQLYIGNDSGPKHIAAAVGLPTIGIHSGVVDAVEWGPIGRRAVALRRNMTCSPCYLANAEDCPRGLACLRQLDPSVVHEAAQLFLASPIPAPAAVEHLVEQPPARPDAVTVLAAKRPDRTTVQAAKPLNGKAAQASPGPAKQIRSTARPKIKGRSSRQGTLA